jgi:hypothetical protein
MIFAWRSIVGGNEPNSDVGLRLIWNVSSKAAIGYYGEGGSHSFFSKSETIMRTFIVIDCSR